MMKHKKQNESKLMTKAKWVLYSGIALNTMLLIAAVADVAKAPRNLGE